MLSKNILSELNRQINAEFYSAYLYLSMESWSNTQGLKGFANWFHVQYQEELFHAEKQYKYILDQGAQVILSAIAQPPHNFESAINVFEQTLTHEQSVTASINQILTAARAESDHATEIMLQWFITEQIEEEANVNDILQQLKLIGGEGSGLFMIDRQLATRVFVPPVASQA